MLKTALLTVIGLAFVALGVFLLVQGDPEDTTLAWGAIAFFGACAAVGIVQLMPACNQLSSAERTMARTLRQRL